ncbi:uncharacterized protein LOC116850509 [Odontomachus brunneus]|uniref:uncharacterized protein LOC116850509 n=1 Tax=Odontomachus brunneus TaxID=486640 RepID=UPI0013F2827F|nr:uncharacterized protein LOC116850509 [Odontomachus brunneus]
MTRFTIVLAILLVALADIQSNVAKAYSDEEENPLKEPLLMRILNAKNRAYEQVQKVKLLASTHHENFIERVNEMVEKAWLDMEIMKKKSGNTNPDCDKKVKDDINDNALKTISTYQSCLSKVTDSADWDMQSMSFEASILIKDIHAAKIVDEELYRRTDEFEAKWSQFGQYMKKLNTCNSMSNLPRLKRQISEAHTSYMQCLN